MSPDYEASLFDRLKARIEEYNRQDYQAVLRAREERDKRQQAEKEAAKAHASDE